MSELPSPDHNHGPGHDADDCPFCKRALAKAPYASVRFVDAKGDLVSIDARKLFDVSEGDIVVIKGRGKTTEGKNMISVTADGIHVRRS